MDLLLLSVPVLILFPLDESYIVVFMWGSSPWELWILSFAFSITKLKKIHLIIFSHPICKLFVLNNSHSKQIVDLDARSITWSNQTRREWWIMDALLHEIVSKYLPACKISKPHLFHKTNCTEAFGESKLSRKNPRINSIRHEVNGRRQCHASLIWNDLIQLKSPNHHLFHTASEYSECWNYLT